MLIQLRNASQSWLLKALLGVIIITFVISFGVGTFSNPKEVVAVVNGHEILLRDFTRRYEQQLADLRQRLGTEADQFAKQLGLKRRLLQSIIDEALYTQAAIKQGLTISAAELKTRIQSRTEFRSAGNFDYEHYREILTSNGIDIGEYEHAEKETALSEKYRHTLLSGLTVGEKQLQLQQRIQNELIEIGYLKLDPKRLPLNVLDPTPEAARKYYEQHSANYQTHPRAKMDYFVLNLADLAQVTQIDPRSVERYYQKHKDSFTTQGRVKIRQILKHVTPAAPSEAPSAKKDAQPAPANADPQTELKNIRAQLITKQARFGDLARQHSDDPSKKQGGALGWFEESALLPEIASVVFSLQKNEISEPIQTMFGWHLIEVQDIKPKIVKPLRAVRGKLLEELKNTRAERQLSRLMVRLPKKIKSDGLQATAARFERPIQSSNWLDESNNRLRLGEQVSSTYRRLTAQNIGDGGVIERNPLQGHIFYQIKAVQPAAPIPFEKVEADILNILRAQAERSALENLAQTTLEKLEDQQAFETFANTYRLKENNVQFTAFQTLEGALGTVPDLQRIAFGLSAQKPFAIAENAQHVYLLRRIKRHLPPADPAAQNDAQLRKDMQQQLVELVLEAEITKLRSEAKIEILLPDYIDS